MNKKSISKARYRAEQRFQLYGKCAISLALLVLVFLTCSIAVKGYNGLRHTEIQLFLNLDMNAIGTKEEQWRHADVSPYIKDSLLKTFPGTTDHREVRELVGLISSGALQEVRNAIIANPRILQQPVAFWLPASDRVDRAYKDGTTIDVPEKERKISTEQLRWLEYLKKQGRVRLTWNLYFLTSADSREPELAGFLGSVVGSIFTLLACMVMAFPIGVMAAIYLEEFAGRNRITSFIELNINNLAAVPSIVFGLLGLSVYINLIGIPRSASVAGGMTLALMILPTIIIATRASLRAVPDSIRDAARGLGASPLQVVLHHTLPLAIPGITTGSIIGLARAVGETAPLLMIGMVAFIAYIPHTPFDPATAMPVQIYLWATSPEESFVEKTNAGILVLLTALAIINSVAMYIRRRFEHRW